MKIWVDNDACPQAIRQVIFKACERLKLNVILVANRYVHPPKTGLASGLVSTMKVEFGPDKADEKILELMVKGDFVITQDIPLAKDAVELGAIVISPRGEVMTLENINERLAMRNLLSHIREADFLRSESKGGPPKLGKLDIEKFANALDRNLTKKMP